MYPFEHTKVKVPDSRLYLFSRRLVDSGFAHIKKLYRRSDVDCLDQMCDVVNKSSTSNVAVSFLNKDGEQNWEWADWKAFLSARFKPVPNIRKYHHFRFSKEEPGCVFVKTGVEDQLERMVNIRKAEPLNDYERPSVIHPAGLSEERLQYLYKTVRPVVRTEFQNKTCPPPGAEE